MKQAKLKALSLFANVGISECYLADLGIAVKVANEIDPERCRFYSHLYPHTEMIGGDIEEKAIFDQIIQKSKEHQVDFLLATPPCQGMSRAGKSDKTDPRNNLIQYAVKAILLLKPRYVFLENVPEQLNTSILYQGEAMKIPDYLQAELGAEYDFAQQNLANAADYGVAQLRERAIFLLTRKDQAKIWQVPEKNKRRVSMKKVIGHLPPLDPFVYDITKEEMLEFLPHSVESHQTALEISPFHRPPRHIKRQVYVMQYTATGNTAYRNPPPYQPKKKDGSIARGYLNTYRRQIWELPAYTITMYNRTISSTNNCHPGRLMDNGLYSDARVLSMYEIMLLSSLPAKWNIPSWASENFIRSVIGEGVPPLFLKKMVEGIV